MEEIVVPKSILGRGSRVRVTGGLQKKMVMITMKITKKSHLFNLKFNPKNPNNQPPVLHLMNGESGRGRTGGGELTCSKKNIGE